MPTLRSKSEWGKNARRVKVDEFVVEPPPPPHSFHSGSAADLAALRCAVAIHQHPLTQKMWGSSTRYCDVCKARGLTDTHACTACGYDECGHCASRSTASAVAAKTLGRPVHPHALKRFEGAPPAYRGRPNCDICKAKSISVTHHCPTCKYDECDACYAKTASAALAAVNASPATAISGGCGPGCSLKHAGDGDCLVCGKGWGPHSGHNCPGGGRGSWRVGGAAKPAAAAAPAPAPAAAASGSSRPVTLEDFPTLVGKQVRYISDPSVTLKGLGLNAEVGALGTRADRRTAVVVKVDASDSTVRVKVGGDKESWYGFRLLELIGVTAAGTAAAAGAAAAAGSWRCVTIADFPALVGKQVRYIVDPAVPLTGLNAEVGALGTRADHRTAAVVRVDTSDNTVRVKVGDYESWYGFQMLEVSGLGAAPAAAPAAAAPAVRPTVGARVKLAPGQPSGSVLKQGDIGELLVDDRTDQPFKVKGPSGNTCWFRDGELVLA